MNEAPVRACADVVVGGSPDRVWAVLADAQSWSSWYADIREVQAARPLQTGDSFSFKTGPVAVEASVDASTSSELLRFTGRSRGASACYEFRLLSVDAGTSVSAEQTMSGPAVRTMRPMLQRIAETSLPKWLAALQRRVEEAP